MNSFIIQVSNIFLDLLSHYLGLNSYFIKNILNGPIISEDIRQSMTDRVSEKESFFIPKC